MITPGATGVCRLDTVTKTKAVQLVQQSCEIGPEERRCAEALYPMVQEAMRDGIYTPRRGSPLCSRGYCVYWRECDERGDACGIDPKRYGAPCLTVPSLYWPCCNVLSQ
jgi:hypothetical protein